MVSLYQLVIASRQMPYSISFKIITTVGKHLYSNWSLYHIVRIPPTNVMVAARMRKISAKHTIYCTVNPQKYLKIRCFSKDKLLSQRVQKDSVNTEVKL